MMMVSMIVTTTTLSLPYYPHLSPCYPVVSMLSGARRGGAAGSLL